MRHAVGPCVTQWVLLRHAVGLCVTQSPADRGDLRPKRASIIKPPSPRVLRGTGGGTETEQRRKERKREENSEKERRKEEANSRWCSLACLQRNRGGARRFNRQVKILVFFRLFFIMFSFKFLNWMMNMNCE